MPSATSKASYLDLPPIPRQESGFVGLLNQGATCYLNSLLQVCYMTPELREAIFRMPLCVHGIDESSDFMEEGRERDILLALQELFSSLQQLDERAISTQMLTKAFGWYVGQEEVQHDVHELNRTLFDDLERSLIITPNNDLIQRLYKGTVTYKTTCSICGTEFLRHEDFCDLGLQVSGCKSVTDSLNKLVEPEQLENDNAYACDTCGEKVNASRQMLITQIPPILTFSLNRFNFDWMTQQNKKLIASYQFPMELSMTDYVDVPQSIDNYELFAVIIHRGTAHQGHYHAYIHDLQKQGTWEPKETVFSEQVLNEELEPKNVVPENETLAELLQFSDDLPPELLAEILQQAAANPIPAPSQQPADEPRQDEPGADESKLTAKQRSKQKRRAEREERQKQEEAKNVAYDSLTPEVTNQALLTNWFDFNDGNVTAIAPGAIMKQFGGSQETAYMLVYRQKNLNENLPESKIPYYWEPIIETKNADSTLKRNLYDEMKNSLEIIVFGWDNFSCENGIVQQTDSASVHIETKFTSEPQLIIAETSKQLNTPLSTLIEFSILSNGYTHLTRDIMTKGEQWNITHLSKWIAIPEPPPADALNYVGKKCQPMVITIELEGGTIDMPVNQAWTIQQLKEQLSDLFGLPPEMQQLSIGGDEPKPITFGPQATLKAAGVKNGTTLSISSE